MTASDPSTRAKWLAKVAKLAPIIAEYRTALEAERHLPAVLSEALADAGLYRIWLPRALGGPELSPEDFMAVVEAVSALDASVGWVVGNGGGMSRAGGYLPEAAARAIFADPRAFIVSSTGAVGDAVPVAGGYQLSGRWPFGSGIHAATHASVLCRIADGRPDNAPQAQLLCYLSMENVEIIDNWHVSGLRGTGSCDFVLPNLHVPADYCHPFPNISATQPGILYRLPGLTAFTWTVATVPLGIARGAMEAFAALAARKGRSGSASVLNQRETVQQEVGRLHNAHGAGRAWLLQTMTAVMEAVEADDGRLARARLDFRLACIHAAETACRIVESLAALAGTAALLETGSLERYLRDVHAASRHRAMSPEIYAVSGRMALGVDLGTDRF